jgi:secondary thiamine-phosphate synthase enzyme
MKTYLEEISLESGEGIALHDITPRLREILRSSGVSNGFMVVTSRHTTTALTINEHESRLLDDLRLFLHRLVPPRDPYLHNDIHLRDCPQDEPKNAHAHICAMLLGSSESIPVERGELVVGQWQSVMLVELDGPRSRKVAVRVIGEWGEGNSGRMRSGLSYPELFHRKLSRCEHLDRVWVTRIAVS